MLNIFDIGGDIIKDNEVYKLKDNTTLNNLVLSSTDMKPYQSTTGHAHPGKEEVYYFVKGTGTMYLNDVPRDVGPGDVVLIVDGIHHRVESNEEGLYFVCVFDGNRRH
jgi:mannose-6-phosphate isomerase-like protein (cupin superfamily)